LAEELGAITCGGVPMGSACSDMATTALARLAQMKCAL